MGNTTKLALEAALKKELLTKPLDKITINDLAEDCGISRMAFYYHFKDIYDLVEWVCVEDGTRALQGKKTYENWQEGLCQIFEAVQENKPFIYECLPVCGQTEDRKLLKQADLPAHCGRGGGKMRRYAGGGGTQGIHCRILQIRFCGSDVRLDRPGNEG